MRGIASILLAGAALSAQAPAWWTRLQAHPSLEATFVQEGESAVFGKVSREGTLKLAPGGRLRVAYTRGILLVCDGRNLIQYDPDTRSAQRMDLQRALAEAPLLAVLMDPKAVDRHFKVTFQGQRVTLAPRQPALPTLEAEGKGAWPTRFHWTDATGAKQVLQLKSPRPAGADAGSFTFQAPAGTRWAEH